jgi:hypothetical protein
MITIYTIAYNEAFMLPYVFAHYMNLFPGADFVVYNNESEDNTADLARMFGAEVRTYKTGGKLSDETYLDIKNNCWRSAKTDWVLIVDVDELCSLSESDLILESANKSDILNFHGYNMVNIHDDMNVGGMRHGVRAPSYDKSYCFNKTALKEINYGMGAHKASPVPYIGQIIKSDNLYIARHYKYINIEYMLKRHAVFASRLSDDNLRRGLGGHYLYPEDRIRKEFEDARKNAYLL